MAWWDFGASKIFNALGPSGDEKSAEKGLLGLGNFSTSEGMSDTLAADNFWKAILSGDPTQMSKVLGPEFSAINKQGQEKKKTASEFGNRSGGTNAGMQMTDDNTRSEIDKLMATLTGSAATHLGSAGSNLLGTAVGADASAFSAARDIKGDWIKNILGAIETGVSAAGAF
jgi:hypothetical protein